MQREVSGRDENLLFRGRKLEAVIEPHYSKRRKTRPATDADEKYTADLFYATGHLEKLCKTGFLRCCAVFLYFVNDYKSITYDTINYVNFS